VFELPASVSVDLDETDSHSGVSDRQRVDFVLITALDEERDAVLRKLPGYRRLEKDGVDSSTYYEARLQTTCSDGAIYRVIVTSIGAMGSNQERHESRGCRPPVASIPCRAHRDRRWCT
jgi:hypothetical protein